MWRFQQDKKARFARGEPVDKPFFDQGLSISLPIPFSISSHVAFVINGSMEASVKMFKAFLVWMLLLGMVP